MQIHSSGAFLTIIAVCLFLSGIEQTSKGTEIPKECLQSLERAEAALRNAEFKYTKQLRDQPSLSGFMRFRDESIQSEFQYDGDDWVVIVWRPDASFRLEKEDQVWVPRSLKPGTSKRDSGGLNCPQEHLLFGGVRLVDLIQNADDSAFETLDFRKQPTNEWVATIARGNSEERWTVTFDETHYWLPTQLTYQERAQNPKHKVLIKYGYGESLHGIPFLSHIAEYENQDLVGEAKIELKSNRAPSNSFFRLEHYGLSESLLKPIGRSEISGWFAPVGFVLLGTILLGLSIILKK